MGVGAVFFRNTTMGCAYVTNLDSKLKGPEGKISPSNYTLCTVHGPLSDTAPKTPNTKPEHESAACLLPKMFEFCMARLLSAANRV